MEKVLRQVLDKLSNLEADVREIRNDQQLMRVDINELRENVGNIDKKTDSILAYVQFLDKDLQRHKKVK